MSEDARKLCRTQGKYSDRSQHYDDRRPQKRFDKRHKGSPAVKEPQDMKFHKRKSDGGKESNTSLCSESDSPVRYQENSDHSFSQLGDVKKSIEIKNPGKHILSNTENGESIVLYDPYFFENDEAMEFMNRLLDTTNWHEKNIVIQGIEYPQPRLVAWYGPLPYTYSGATLEAAEMPDCVLEIKKKVEEYLSKNGINVKLNSVLLNFYRHNKDSVSWHSDDEMSMGVCPTIASVSLGETRRFQMRRKLKQADDGSSDEYFVHLTNGSLIIMDGCMQKDWQHQVPKEYHDRCRRINLTFRTVYNIEDLHSSLGSCSKKQPINNALKKSHRSKADFDVYYDDENFPPLNSDTSPVCSDAAKISQDTCASMLTENGNESSGSYKRGNIEDSSYNRTPMKKSIEISVSEDIRDCELSPCDKSTLKWEKICKPEKTRSLRQTHNKTSLKTRDKANGSTEIYDSEHSFSAGTSLSAVDKINDTEEFWDNDPPSCSENFQNAKMNGSNKKALQSSSNEKSTLLNNLNKSNVKIDMQSKNLHAYNSDLSSNNVTNTPANSIKNEDFSSDNHNVPTDSPVNNMQETAYKVENETKSKKDSGWTPNVQAKVFVPVSICTTVVEDTTYSSFQLENLLNYNVELMNCEALIEYTNALRKRVLDKIRDFRFADREELSMLCEITDGDQSIKNQKIITARMLFVVERAIKNLASPNYRKPYGNPRKPNHGNQNYHSERRYQGGGRESYQRY